VVEDVRWRGSFDGWGNAEDGGLLTVVDYWWW
jgi:hypothetical protein